jgi:hypothetical protein
MFKMPLKLHMIAYTYESQTIAIVINRMCTVLPVVVANYGYNERNFALHTPNVVDDPTKKE